MRKQRMGVSKDDGHAKRHWGEKAYAAIPKSVFATLAWHLANANSGKADEPGAAEVAAMQELEALADQIMPAKQALAAIRAIKRYVPDSVAQSLKAAE